jgi:hypothetical protein
MASKNFSIKLLTRGSNSDIIMYIREDDMNESIRQRSGIKGIGWLT